MKTGNEVAATILWILFGFFILHVIQGTGSQWLKSFVSAGAGGQLGSMTPGAEEAIGSLLAPNRTNVIGVTPTGSGTLQTGNSTTLPSGNIGVGSTGASSLQVK